MMEKDNTLNWLMNREIIDLTHNLDGIMKTYPTVSKPIFKILHNTSIDGFQDTEMCLNSHTGTHIDAPLHMMQRGSGISEIPISSLIGRSVIINLSYKKRKEEITKEDLIPFQKMIEENDMIVLYTGWTKYYNEDFYSTDYPYLDISAAAYLSLKGIKFVGTDGLSIAGFTTDFEDKRIHIFETHRLFLEKNIYIGEELNTERVVFPKNENFIQGLLIALPIKLVNGDAGLSRIVFIR